jgi:hypothetical protein
MSCRMTPGALPGWHTSLHHGAISARKGYSTRDAARPRPWEYMTWGSAGSMGSSSKITLSGPRPECFSPRWLS